MGPENLEEEQDDCFKLALIDENLSKDERNEVMQFYKKYQAIKHVLIEYANLKNMEDENDLKSYTKKKKELLRKIWRLNQEHKISLMSK